MGIEIEGCEGIPNIGPGLKERAQASPKRKYKMTATTRCQPSFS
jgi:hypothetical protein